MTALLFATLMVALSATGAGAQSTTRPYFPETEDENFILKKNSFPGEMDIELLVLGAPPLKPTDTVRIFRGTEREDRIEILSFGPGSDESWPLRLRATDALDESAEYTVEVRDSTGKTKARFILPLFPSAEPAVEQIYVDDELTNQIRLAPASADPVAYRISLVGGPYYKGLKASLQRGPKLDIVALTRDRVDLVLKMTQEEVLALTPGETKLRLSYLQDEHEKLHPVILDAPALSIALKSPVASLRPGEKKSTEFRITNLLNGHSVMLVDPDTGEGEIVTWDLDRKKGSNEAILTVNAHLDYKTRLQKVVLQITSADGSVARSSDELNITNPPSVSGTLVGDEPLTFGHHAHIEFDRTGPGVSFEGGQTYRMTFPSLGISVDLTDIEISFDGEKLTAHFDLPVPDNAISVASSYDYRLTDEQGNMWQGTFASIHPYTVFRFTVDSPTIRPAERRAFTLSNAVEGYHVTTPIGTGLRVIEGDLADGKIVLEADTLSLDGSLAEVDRSLSVIRNGQETDSLFLQIVPWNTESMDVEWSTLRNGEYSWTSFEDASDWPRIPQHGTFFVRHADSESRQNKVHLVVTSTHGDVVFTKTIRSWKVGSEFRSEVTRLNINSKFLSQGRAFTVHFLTPSGEQIGKPVTFYAGRTIWEQFNISGGPNILQNPLFRGGVTKPRVLEGASLTLNYTPDWLNRKLRQEDNLALSAVFIFTPTENDRIAVGFGLGSTLFNTALVGIGTDLGRSALDSDQFFFILGTSFKLTSLSKLSNIL